MELIVRKVIQITILKRENTDPTFRCGLQHLINMIIRSQFVILLPHRTNITLFLPCVINGKHHFVMYVNTSHFCVMTTTVYYCQYADNPCSWMLRCTGETTSHSPPQ